MTNSVEICAANPVSCVKSTDKFSRLFIPIIVTAFTATFYYYDINVNMIATGDHGRGLYAGWSIIKGEMPYRDFPFRYGPLGIYAIVPFLMLFGVTLKAAFISWYVYTLIGTFRLTQLLVRIGKWQIALIGILPFVLAYRNHMHSFVTAPGLVCMIEAFTAVMILMRRQTGLGVWLRLGLWCTALTGCKPNIGIAFTAGIATGLALLYLVTRGSDKAFTPAFGKVIWSVATFFISLFVISAVFIIAAPTDFLVKSFPYGSDQRVVWFPFSDAFIIPFVRFFLYGKYTYTFEAFVALWRENVYIWGAAITLALLMILASCRQKVWTWEYRIALVFFLPTILPAHEFLLSGSEYTITYWGLAGGSVLICAAASVLMRRFEKSDSKSDRSIILNTAIGILVTWLAFLVIWTNVERDHRFHSQKGKMIKGPGGFISAYDGNWATVVNSGVRFILSNTEPSEKILALTYDPLYCVLTHRRQAGPFSQYQFICRITPENDRTVIEALKRDNVRCIVISNLAQNPPPRDWWKGKFGITHGELLWKYIVENYSPLETVEPIGNWDVQAQWITGHSIKIYWSNAEQEQHPSLGERLSEIYKEEKSE